MEITYLLMFPFEKTSVAGDQIKLTNFKSSPYFLDIDINIKLVDKKSFKTSDKKVVQKTFVYDNSVLLFQFSYRIEEQLSDQSISVKSKINRALRQRTVDHYGYKGRLIEEYSVLLPEKPKNIQNFVRNNQLVIARFIRSVDKKIDYSDAKEILQSRVSYSQDDVAIIDWEGALLLDRDDDFDSQLELLKIGNYQLLRYRILDKLIEDNLEKVRSSIENPKKSILDNSIIRSVIKDRLTLLLNFDKVDQSLLLVGDWYTAKLYKIIMEEFYVDDWRILVKNKLDNLEAVDSAARENLVFNWRRFLDIAQIVGWFVILVGYFLLLLSDAKLI